MTKYLIGALGIVLIIASIFFNAWRTERNNSLRWEQNFQQLQDSTSSLILLQRDELKNYIKNELDSFTKGVLEEANIKPKQVTEITNINNYYEIGDTIIITPKPIVSNGEIKYPVLKKIDCLTIEGFMTVKDTIPSLYLTEGTGFNNDIVFVQYWEKRKYKFLFWNWRLFGKKQYELHGKSKCGNLVVKQLKTERKQ